MNQGNEFELLFLGFVCAFGSCALEFQLLRYSVPIFVIVCKMDGDDLDKAARMLASANSIAVLTGAGVSAESGVPTFRGAGGIWKNYRADQVATPEAFRDDPRLVWEFY